jgi:hypothetical protein
MGGQRWWSSDQGRRRGPGPGRMDIRSDRGILNNGALVGDGVSVPTSPGRMHIHSARDISDNGALVGDAG